MTDAARAKAMDLVRSWWSLCSDPSWYGARGPLEDRITEALDAYAAEQTAALRAFVEKAVEFMALFPDLAGGGREIADALYLQGDALLADPEGQRIAEQWRVVLTCCGRDAGEERFSTWAEADTFRQSYTSGPSVDRHGYGDCACGEILHRRSGVILAAVERSRQS